MSGWQKAGAKVASQQEVSDPSARLRKLPSTDKLEANMAQCGYCGTTILFGGVRDGAQRFCNNTCHQNAYVLSVAQHVPADLVDRQTEEVFRGNCPKCRGIGPIDVHKVHRVWSVLVLTNWSSYQQVCCRSCATKSQLGGALFCLFLGWWGFPWGLVLTPVQITRNIVGMWAGPDSSRPSADLRKLVQVNLGLQMLQAGSQTAAATPPLIRS
jgi:hypothetical protein